MNASIVYKSKVEGQVLDELAKELPSIIAQVLEVPGGYLARLKPEQVSTVFSEASARDVGSDIRIMAFARSNDPRAATGTDRAKAILEKVLALSSGCGAEYSVDVRLYFMEISVAEHTLNG